MKTWFGHLKIKVLSFGIVMSILPLSFFGWYGVNAARQAQVEIVQTQNQAAARTVAEELGQFINNLHTPLQLLAGTYGAGLTRLEPSERERVLYILLRDVPYLEEVALTDAGTHSLTRVSRREVTTGAGPINYDPAPDLSSVKLDVDGRPLIEVGVSLPDKAGALVARATLRGVFANIATVRGSGELRVHVVDGSGRLIGDSDFSLVLAGNTWQPPGPDQPIYQSITGDQVIGVSTPVPGTSWRVVAEVSVTTAMAPVRRLGWEFGGGALVLMAGIIALSVVFGLQLTTPLERLEAGARRIGTGDFSTKVPEGGRDELGRLITAFNGMAERLAVARQAEKLAAVGQLAAGIAHEINNPLAVISAYGEDLADRLGEEGAAKLNQEGVLTCYLAELQHQVLRCKAITRNLLDFARQGSANPEPVDVADVARQTAALTGPRARRAGVALQVEAQPDLPPVRATRDQLQQVFLNLISNALDAIEGQGEIRIDIAGADGSVRTTVTDTGSGMDKATLVRALEPFFTTKPVGRGTGLGLSTCYGIITGLGGKMEITSAPGQGTTISFTLPPWEESACASTHS